MPSVSKKQHNFMAAVANNPKFAKKTGIPQSVGKDFLEADKGKEFRKGGTTNPAKAKIANPRPRAGMLQMPNVSLKKYGFKEEISSITLDPLNDQNVFLGIINFLSNKSF
jgi:hypothetical protein